MEVVDDHTHAAQVKSFTAVIAGSSVMLGRPVPVSITSMRSSVPSKLATCPRVASATKVAPFAIVPLKVALAAFAAVVPLTSSNAQYARSPVGKFDGPTCDSFAPPPAISVAPLAHAASLKAVVFQFPAGVVPSSRYFHVVPMGMIFVRVFAEPGLEKFTPPGVPPTSRLALHCSAPPAADPLRRASVTPPPSGATGHSPSSS